MLRISDPVEGLYGPNQVYEAIFDIDALSPTQAQIEIDRWAKLAALILLQGENVTEFMADEIEIWIAFKHTGRRRGISMPPKIQSITSPDVS